MSSRAGIVPWLNRNRMELHVALDTTSLSSAKKHSRGPQMTSSDARGPPRCFRDSNWSAALLLQNQVTITSADKPKLCPQLMFYFSWPLSVQPWPSVCPTFIYSFMNLAKACLLLLSCQFQSGVNHLNINKLHINVEQFCDRHHTLGKAQICQFMIFLQNQTQACMVLQIRIQNCFFFKYYFGCARTTSHNI